MNATITVNTSDAVADLRRARELIQELNDLAAKPQVIKMAVDGVDATFAHHILKDFLDTPTEERPLLMIEVHRSGSS